MSKFIGHTAHKECGSSDGLAIYDEGNRKTGYCFACSTYVGQIDGDVELIDKPNSIEDIVKKVREIGKYPSRSLVDRRLNKATLDQFNVKVGVSLTDGETPEVLYFPYEKEETVVAWKCKLIPNKKFWITGNIKDTNFFGWDQAVATGNKRLYITEGELDALAVWQVLSKRTGPEYPPPAVVSIPNGASSAKAFLSSKAQDLRRFKEIVLVFDNDSVGEEALKAASTVLPGAKTIQLPSKDPNAALIEGKERALANALLFQAESPKNTSVVLLDSLVDAALKPVPMGLEWPWEGLTRLTRGLRYGETYYFGAGPKMGKSDLANTFVSHFAVQHGLPVYIANMEETNVKSTKKILGKIAGKIFHDPNVPFQSSDLLNAAQKIQGKVHFVDAYQHITWEYLQQDIISVVNNLGVKLVLIDPITNLTNGIPSSEVDTILRGVSQDLSAMARDLDIAIFIFCHCKAPSSGAPHELGGRILSSQFTGSRAMARSCNYMVGLEGNKDPNLTIEQRNLRKLVILEDREFGETGIIDLYWDYRTQLFTEVDGESLREGIPESSK